MEALVMRVLELAPDEGAVLAAMALCVAYAFVKYPLAKLAERSPELIEAWTKHRIAMHSLKRPQPETPAPEPVTLQQQAVNPQNANEASAASSVSELEPQLAEAERPAPSKSQAKVAPNVPFKPKRGKLPAFLQTETQMA
jgi:hypothetical protein